MKEKDALEDNPPTSAQFWFESDDVLMKNMCRNFLSKATKMKLESLNVFKNLLKLRDKRSIIFAVQLKDTCVFNF